MGAGKVLSSLGETQTLRERTSRQAGSDSLVFYRGLLCSPVKQADSSISLGCGLLVINWPIPHSSQEARGRAHGGGDRSGVAVCGAVYTQEHCAGQAHVWLGYMVYAGEKAGAPKLHALMISSCPRPLVRGLDLREGLIPTGKDPRNG